MTTLIITLGVITSLIGLGLCMRLWLLPASELRAKKGASLHIIAALGFVILPLGAVAVANYQTFEGVKGVEACGSCHVMQSKVDDMKDAQSRTLAARHYQNRWIAENQCHSCHSDYGLSGTLKSKADGFRHLARYVTGAHADPVAFRGVFNNQNCTKCHGETEKFQAISSHATLQAPLMASQTSCLNCHGRAHADHEIPLTYQP